METSRMTWLKSGQKQSNQIAAVPLKWGIPEAFGWRIWSLRREFVKKVEGTSPWPILSTKEKVTRSGHSMTNVSSLVDFEKTQSAISWISFSFNLHCSSRRNTCSSCSSEVSSGLVLIFTVARTFSIFSTISLGGESMTRDLIRSSSPFLLLKIWWRRGILAGSMMTFWRRKEW